MKIYNFVIVNKKSNNKGQKEYNNKVNLPPSIYNEKRRALNH